MTERAATLADVATLPWWHSIDLGNGVVTPGHKSPKLLKTEADLVFRDSVAGKSVLDIGAWDGYFSFEAKRRGASRVLATDWNSWTGRNFGSRACFDLARATLGLDVEDRTIEMYDVGPDTVGTFDVVLYLGVLYHLKDPLGALERVAAVTRERLVLETHLDGLKVREPVMVFYKGDKLNGDPNNWWGPNVSCMREMLEECGFRRVDFVKHPHHRDRGFFYASR
jgi:tRNA (mo5U34)-methyltransferase